nr:DotH/IcmK family type IV secretion protein [Pseudomonas syringae]
MAAPQVAIVPRISAQTVNLSPGPVCRWFARR